SAKERRVKTRPTVLVAGDAEEQERLAALAPSSALRAPSPASGRRAIRPGLPQAGEGLSDRVSRKREKGYSTGSPASGGRAVRSGLPQAGEGLFDRVSRRRERG